MMKRWHTRMDNKTKRLCTTSENVLGKNFFLASNRLLNTPVSVEKYRLRTDILVNIHANSRVSPSKPAAKILTNNGVSIHTANITNVLNDNIILAILLVKISAADFPCSLKIL